jgi:hypothetical protein
MLPPELSVEAFCSVCDQLTNIIRSLKGTPESGFGAGVGLTVPIEQDYGFSRAVREYEQMLMSLGHYPTSGRLMQNAHAKTVRGGDQLILDHLFDLLRDLSNVCASTKLPTSTRHSNIAGFATYYNTWAGGPYNALVSRELADIFELWYKSTSFEPHNVYCPSILNMGSRVVGRDVIPVTFVDPKRYAGVEIQANIEGYQGGPGTLTVVGAGRMAHGGVANDERVWSSKVDGDGNVDLLPDVLGDLCLAVRAIGLPAAMTAGAVVIKGLLPARLR